MECFTWILDRKLATSPGPAVCTWSVDFLKQQGVQIVVSLADQNEAVLLSDFEHFPFYLNSGPFESDKHVYETLRNLDSILEKMHDSIQSQKPVLVHCQMGKERTGMVVAAYLIKYHNVTAKEALDFMQSKLSDSEKPYCLDETYAHAVGLFSELMLYQLH